MNTQTHKHKDTLCWYCKRNPAYGVYNPEDFTQYDQTCPWLENGTPIKGWRAKRGIEIDVTDAEGNTKHEFGYEIKYCPLYKEGIRETTYYEYLNKVQGLLGYCDSMISKKTELCLQRYEEKFHEKVPEWVWEECRFRKYEKRSKKGQKNLSKN